MFYAIPGGTIDQRLAQIEAHLFAQPPSINASQFASKYEVEKLQSARTTTSLLVLTALCLAFAAYYKTLPAISS